ncbi:MAG: hypothetical protein F6J92_35600 [Symploca sp. SIO1A3]|nr:hypothetical protein [Symploca sp. SIO1A3]
MSSLDVVLIIIAMKRKKLKPQDKIDWDRQQSRKTTTKYLEKMVEWKCQLSPEESEAILKIDPTVTRAGLLKKLLREYLEKHQASS